MRTSDDYPDADLLRPLRDVDGNDCPPPRYDVATAMLHGETIRRRRMSAAVLVAVAVIAAAIAVPLGVRSDHNLGPAPATSASRSPSPSPSPSPSTPGPLPAISSAAQLPVADCTVTALTAPASAGAFTTSASGYLDPTGHYLAVSLVKPFTLPLPNYTPGKALLVDLSTGQMTLIPVAEGGVAGVNASGVVIGSTGASGAGWVYRNGSVTPLPKFHGVAAEPFAINARGDIVGQVTIGNTITSVIWPAAQPGTVRALLPTGMLAYTIADNGTIGGSIGDQDHYRPYVGDGKGNGHTLPTGATDPRGQVQDISGDYAAGWALNNFQQGLFPMVWNLATGARTPYPQSVLYEVASDGTVAGDVSTDDGAAGSRIGLIGHGGALERLPTGAADDLPVYVYAIAADGHTIYGARHTSTNSDGPISQVGLLWHC